MGKIKEEDLEKEGSMSIAQMLRDAGKIANKDTEFISNYLRSIRREIVENSLTIRTALTNMDSLCGSLDGLRIMVDRLFKDPEKIKKGEKLFIRGSWDLPVGSKVRNAFNNIERKVLESIFSDDKEIIERSEHANELTKAIVKALEEQKEILEKHNNLLRKAIKGTEENITRESEKVETVKKINEELHQDTGHISIKEDKKK